MKQYELKYYGKDDQNNWVDILTCNNYNDAMAFVQGNKDKYPRVDIALYELKKSECIDADDFNAEWECNRGDHLVWEESWKDGKRTPMVISCGIPIWRWGSDNREKFPAEEVIKLNDTLIPTPTTETPPEPKKRGGRREGSGRKNTGRSESISVRISPEAREIMKQQPNQNAFIDTLIKEWAKNH